jgi:hypothetical protein
MKEADRLERGCTEGAQETATVASISKELGNLATSATISDPQQQIASNKGTGCSLTRSSIIIKLKSCLETPQRPHDMSVLLSRFFAKLTGGPSRNGDSIYMGRTSITRACMSVQISPQ